MLRLGLGWMAALAIVGCGSSDGSDGASATELTVMFGASGDGHAHSDALSGQTPRSVRAGVRSLTLIDESSGEGWVLFDHGPGGQEVAWDAGANTVIAVIPPAAVKAGHYTRARMVQDWSRFTIDATLHEGADAMAGTLTGLQVTSEGAVVEGSARPQGYYEQTFSGPGVEREFSGDDAPLADQSQTAGAEAIIENGQWAVYFPLDLSVEAEATGVLNVRANMSEAFRWEDLPMSGFEAGAYDMTPPLYEPVLQFGANRFDVTLAAQ